MSGAITAIADIGLMFAVEEAGAAVIGDAIFGEALLGGSLFGAAEAGAIGGSIFGLGEAGAIGAGITAGLGAEAGIGAAFGGGLFGLGEAGAIGAGIMEGGGAAMTGLSAASMLNSGYSANTLANFGYTAAELGGEGAALTASQSPYNIALYGGSSGASGATGAPTAAGTVSEVAAPVAHSPSPFVAQAAATPVNAWANPSALSSLFSLGEAGVAGTGALAPSSVFSLGAAGPVGAAAAAPAAAGGLWGTITDAAKIISPIANIGSSVYGMEQQNAMRKAQQAQQSKIAGSGTGSIAAADSWGSSGGRAVADTQLQGLLQNPAQVGAADPSYALRIQAAQRAMAGMGQDSGAMAVAAANASTSWYNDRLAQLASLSGASNTTGAQATSLAIQNAQGSTSSAIAANGLAGQSLASLGYGLSQLTGSASMPPEVKAWMQSQGLLK